MKNPRKQGEIYLSIAPFVIKLQTSIPSVIKSINYLYKDSAYRFLQPPDFADFHITIAKTPGLRKWIRPQVQFFYDGKKPFKPLPYSQSYPFFEWGLNWCIAAHTYQYLLLHAAVVEKNGQALILPGQPGAGKSTLCAALTCKGWRLLSDEMAVLDLSTNELIPIVRPISLKNKSIDLIVDFSAQAEMGDSFLDTSKGTVAHMKPPRQSVADSKLRAKGRWVVFPQYTADAKISFQPITKGQTVIKLAENSFNYNVLGEQGFTTLCDLVERCDCYELSYSQLDDIVAMFSELANDDI